MAQVALIPIAAYHLLHHLPERVFQLRATIGQVVHRLGQVVDEQAVAHPVPTLFLAVEH
ncbi:hypothetical protein D3C80_2166970 [compost metagenome]